MTRYLILGANGFLGQQVRRRIQRADPAAFVVAASGHRELPGEGSGCHWQRMDLVRASVEDIVALLDFCKPDVVINSVGCTSGSVEELEAVNVSVVRKLLEALVHAHAGRLVHLGSAAEYGTQPQGVAFVESAAARPVGDYGRTKLVATDLIMDRVARGDVDATVLRVFDPVGPGCPGHSLAGTAVWEIRRALDIEASFVTLGQLSSCRDFLAATDVADAALRAAHTAGVPPLLNVGRGVAMSGRSMVELVAAAAGFEGDIFESRGGAAHATQALWQQADLTLIRRHLHWVPTTSIAEAVSGLWQSGS